MSTDESRSDQNRDPAAEPSSTPPTDARPARPLSLDSPEENPRLARWEQLLDTPLLVAAAFFLVAYAAPILKVDMSQEGHQIARWVQLVVWVMFLVDLLVRVSLAHNRRRYLVSNWIGILSVALPALRPIAALNQVIGRSVLSGRGIRLFRGRMAMIVAASTSIVAVVASLAVLNAERGRSGANISNFADALWWSMTTITTVGYGDYYPVTGTGRMFAAGLMITGIGLLGVVTATLATWFVDRVRDAEESDPGALTPQQAADHLFRTTMIDEVRELRRQVSALQALVAQRQGPGETAATGTPTPPPERTGGRPSDRGT
ncbi:MAG: potassium channel family protein [Actinomycetales bacterium]